MLNCDVFYYAQPVDSVDEAVSLAEYLNQHGVLAYKSEGDHGVDIPMECGSSAEVADKTAAVHTLVSTWRMFWEHSDKGLFGLPIYSVGDQE